MAVRLYEIALSINPSFLESYYGLANLYFKNGFWDKAIKAYQDSLKIKSVYIIWNNLGNVYYNKKEFNKAINSYQESIRLKPDFGLTFYNLGFIYMHNKELDKAIFYLKKVLIYNPMLLVLIMIFAAYIQCKKKRMKPSYGLKKQLKKVLMIGNL